MGTAVGGTNQLVLVHNDYKEEFLAEAEENRECVFMLQPLIDVVVE